MRTPVDLRDAASSDTVESATGHPWAGSRPAHRFMLGTFRCTVVDDGTYDYGSALFFGDADPVEVARALAERGLTVDRIPSPYACLLVDTGSRLVLIDTGGAGWHPSVGRLHDSLRTAGVEPADIETVILTHGHPDHIGGNADEQGAPVFRNARHVMASDEWSFWTRPETLRQTPEKFQRSAMANLPPIADQLELTNGEREIVTGIRVLPTPGHTPGHLAVVVESEGEELIFVSDAALHPIHLEHPAWHPSTEIDPVQAAASKRMLFDRAARLGSLVLAYHFDPFPCLGHVAAVGDAWRWEPLQVGVPFDRNR